MFFLFALVLVITFLSVFYVLNFYHQILNEQAVYNDQSKSFSILYDGDDVTEKLDIFSENNTIALKRIFVEMKNGDDIILSNYYGNSNAKIKVFFGNYFSMTSKNEIIIPRSNALQIGDSYYINDQPFEIVGINAEEVFEIPYQRNVFSGELMITFITEDILSKDSSLEFQSLIKIIFEVESVKLPTDSKVNANYLVDIIIIVLLLSLSLLNASYLFSCLLSKYSEQCRVFKILGCSPTRCFFLYLSELLVLSTVFFAISALLFNYLFIPVMSNLSNFYVNSITLTNYLEIYIIMIIVLFLLNFVNLRKVIKS